MSANKYRPHLLVIPEDDANRQLANGFVKRLPIDRQRQIKVDGPAGGWLSALTLVQTEQIAILDQLPNRNIVLLIDFDGKVDDRRKHCQGIPDRHACRVFVLGVRREPENLKQALPGSTFERIGAALADECFAAHWDKWNHRLLVHNARERARLRPIFLSLFT